MQRILVTKIDGIQDDSRILDRLIDAFDIDHDGQIDFHEFVFGMDKMVSGSLDEKLELLFSVYDLNGDGDISIAEMCQLLAEEQQDLKQLIAFSDEVIASLDVDGDGSITREEFVSVVKDEHVLLDLFFGSLPNVLLANENDGVGDHGLAKHALDAFRQVRGGGDGNATSVTFETFAVLWKCAAVEGTTAFSAEEFSDFVHEGFNVGSAVKPSVSRLFQALVGLCPLVASGNGSSAVHAVGRADAKAVLLAVGHLFCTPEGDCCDRNELAYRQAVLCVSVLDADADDDISRDGKSAACAV
jgi:Ca2+-binding EF-hand superfamily protein